MSVKRLSISILPTEMMLTKGILDEQGTKSGERSLSTLASVATIIAKTHGGGNKPSLASHVNLP
jgi:hypothetical protein